MSEDAEEGHDCPQQRLHVEEADELQRLVAGVVASGGAGAADANAPFRAIVSKYQEQPQLLDPLLESVVSPLAGLLAALAHEHAAAGCGGGEREADMLARVGGVARLLWHVSTVRGHKTVVRFFPNDVADFEPTVALLLAADAAEAGAGAALSFDDPRRMWEAPAVLLLWLSMLVLVPFDMALIDSSAAGLLGQGAAGRGCPPLVQTVLALCRRRLASPGSGREMAAAVLGRLLVRPDAAAPRAEFVDWSCAVLCATAADSREGAFLVPGVLLSLAGLFQHGQRAVLLEPAERVLPAAVELLASKSVAGSALTRKLGVKLVQRVGLAFLRARRRGWQDDAGQGEDDLDRYGEQVESVVGCLLSGLSDRDTVVRWSAAKGLGRLAARLPADAAEEVAGSVLSTHFATGASDGAWHGGCLALAELARRGLLAPEELGRMVPLVVAALQYDVRRGPTSVGAHVRDAAAYVCWAFARAYVPSALGAAVDALAAPLITLACYDREVNCRRAAAAAFQECVGRLGSFPHGIDILTCADYFTVSTRPAAYLEVAPQVARLGGGAYLEHLARHLLACKLRHWEKSLRELAARALAALVPLRPAFFAETALPALLPLCTDGVLEARHGAVAAVAELLPALRESGVHLPEGLQAQVAGIVLSIERAKLNRGKGGEVMRSAICRLIETQSMTGLPLSAEQHAATYRQLRDNLHHPSAPVQQGAAAALDAFARQYLCSGGTANGAAGDTADATPVVATFLAELEDRASPVVQRGAALALGALPRALLEPRWAEVVGCLARASASEGGPGAQDAETRVNAVKALASVAGKLWGAPRHPAAPPGAPPEAGGAAEAGGLGAEAATVQAAEALVAALGDYAADNRGDVGSWVREAAMAGLASLLATALPACLPGLTCRSHLAGLANTALLGMAQQAVERIGRVREAAGAALQALLPAALAAGLPAAAPLAQAVSGWTPEQLSTQEALPSLAGLLAAPGCELALLQGLAFSVGGKDGQLSAAAGEALVGAVEGLGEEGCARVADALVAAWEAPGGGAGGAGRLAAPLLATAAVLLARTPLRGLQPPCSELPAALLRMAGAATRGCTSIPCLEATADLLCELAGSAADPVGHEALRSALRLLGYRYPKVRRSVAERLYTTLLLADGSVPLGDVDAAMEVLGGTAWDGPLPEVRPAQARLAACLGVALPVSAGETPSGESGPGGGAAGQAAAARDENESYAALIDHVSRFL